MNSSSSSSLISEDTTQVWLVLTSVISHDVILTGIVFSQPQECEPNAKFSMNSRRIVLRGTHTNRKEAQQPRDDHHCERVEVIMRLLEQTSAKGCDLMTSNNRMALLLPQDSG